MARMHIGAIALIIFLIVSLVITLPISLVASYTYNEDKALVDVNLKSERSKCQNIITHNTEDLPDFINYERAGSDKNAFMINDRCYSLMNNYNVVYNKAIKEFYKKFFGKIFAAFIFSLLVTGAVTCSVFAYRRDEDDDDEYRRDWY